MPRPRRSGVPGLRTASNCRRAYRTTRHSARMATADTASMRRSALTAEIRIHDDGPMIVATVALPDCTPDRALAAFTEGAAVSRWWRGDLKAQPAEGGPYTIDFPAISAGLTGRVVS